MTTVRQFDKIDASDISRFWIWVEKSENCWEWVGNKDRLGYGIANTSDGKRLAHRMSWFISNGSIDDRDIDHVCHNTSCIKPEHLRPATAKENAENLLPVRAASGYRGVYKAGKKWMAGVKHNGTDYRIGEFDTPEQANSAVVALRNKLFTHNILDHV